MSDIRHDLQKMFQPARRYSNFGNVLTRIRVQDMRCHRDTVIEISSPITAFCGMNGTGKSTLLQLAAVAYSSPESASEEPYYVSDFLVVGRLDPAPFTPTASVEYTFWQPYGSLKHLTLSRSTSGKRWLGYGRRPQRYVFFAGIGLYLPKIEQHDFIVRKALHIKVTKQQQVLDRIKNRTSKVLGCGYEEIRSYTVTYQQQQGRVVVAKRGGTTYSEAHMGYGEGRAQHLIETLENLPEKSLVLIEEPETSLHPNAQYELGRYFLDVVKTRRHQILLTTHSESILKALHPASRIYLKRTPDQGVIPIAGLTAGQANSLMAEGHEKALHILVEDECARSILCEIIRRFDSDLRTAVSIQSLGGESVVTAAIKNVKLMGIPLVGVLDGDQKSAPKDDIFKLPGTEAPEKELFKCTAVAQHIQKAYGISLADFAASMNGIDHHDWFSRLEDRVQVDKSFLIREAAREYASNLGSEDQKQAATLVQQLKEAIASKEAHRI